MLPLNSSSEHLLSSSSTTLAKTKASQGSKKQGLKFTGNLSKVKYSQSQNRLQGRDSEQEFIGMMGIAN
jgi:tetratricopeptide (TPR) repeat protein